MTYPTINKSQNSMERSKFVDSPTRPENEAVEVFVGNKVEFDDNVEQDFSDGDISAIKAVYKTINGVALAESNDVLAKAEVIGITRTGATDGNKIKYKINGKLEDSSLNFPINDQIYLGANGELTNIAPTVGHRTRLGTSGGNGIMNILIEEPIIL